MLKIRALNREASSDEDVPVIKEAQEEIALELYNKALRIQGEQKYSESESILLQLINENIPILENNGGLPKSMSNLKYSCYVNLGNIYLKLQRASEALEKYLAASELDSTDVTLWYKIGNISLKLNEFRQSAYAFSKGLECSESHWPCLDKLISILYAIKDTIACLVYIGKALILDPEYGKGLVLRRQIYRDNPATKDYYQLYNPDYIWEPPLDTPIDEEDEKEHLQEAQILCDLVTEIEKSLAPKPLQTIPLPRPLKEHTWLALADTITHLHQYIADNEMSHFTFIDVKRCMSQTKDPPPEAKCEILNLEEKIIEEKPPEGVVNADEKMDTVEVPPERRFSQTSETNNEAQENTPVQTDNDEEQNMDQDNDDQDDNVESKDRSKPRGSKRKRDLLSDLQTWGWYSRRKLSKKAKDKDFTVEDALERIIPKHLLPYRIDPEKFNNFEDSMNTMDLYNMYIENEDINYLSPIHSPKSVNYEAYFGTDRENVDVTEFWSKQRDYCDAIVLVKDLVFTLAKLWRYKWPKELIPFYIKAYEMFREHCDQPQVFCSDAGFEDVRNDALATILYGELLCFSSEGVLTLPATSVGYLQLVSGWQDDWKDEYPMFFVRVFWLRTHLFRREKDNDLAIRSLEVIRDVMEEEEAKSGERYMLSLPNCSKYGLITIEVIEKILKHLDMINSLATVEGLFNAEKYTQVADIIKLTFNDTGIHPQVGRMGRPAQLGLIMHSLWFTDCSECFVWTEKCLNEAFEQYLKFSKDHDKWEKVIEKCLAILYEIIKKETVCVIDLLEEGNRSRLVENLAKIVSKQLNFEGVTQIPLNCITPWILLHYVLQREEQREYASKRRGQCKRDGLNEDQHIENDLPSSIAILFSAHEFLGAKGWCLTNQGELLHFILDTLLDKLDTPIFECLRRKIDIHLEQAMFCLYEHPSKKNKVSRHLADHNVDPLPLTWERSFQLFEFYVPDCLPEFNSYKDASISADSEQLLKRIIALVPSQCAPQQHLPKIMDYIHGKTEKFPEAIDFPNKVRAIYYLIGDFYFKQKEFDKCIKYFQLDLCMNPLRLDSWACLGLSYSALLDTKLNHCTEFKSEMEFLEKAKYASICFKKALEICPDPLMLWIECGTFQYTVHSYCSRILKFESENLSIEKFEFLENQKNSYLDSSGDSFEKAIALYETKETNEADERWLQYYILGKIAEKKQKPPTEYLQHYMTASTLLDENKAEYPDKIHYNHPQHLAVEALELHYRIYASVLKYLELHEGRAIPNALGDLFKKCLNSSKFRTAPPPTPPKLIIEPEVAINSSSGFQEQFLNALDKLGKPDEVKTAEKKDTATIDPTEIAAAEKSEDNARNEAVKDSEDVVKAPSESMATTPVEVASISAETKPTLTSEDDNKVSVDTKEEEDVVEVKEDVDVIMISDSDEEDDVGNKAGEEKIEKSEAKDEKAEDGKISVEIPATTDNINSEKTKDVQQMLDEMMEKTMKETEEQRNDSDISGADRIEEVVPAKEVKEVEEMKNPNKVEVDETKRDKSKKAKPSDSETDAENIRTSVDDSSSNSSSSSSSSDSSDSDSEDDDDTSSSSSSSSDASNEFMSHNEVLQLIDKCITGLEMCISRLPQNYKALYRLAHLYFNYDAIKDLTKCRQLLLSKYNCKDGTIVAGLFNDRKPNNFFSGIWRIPSTEIDRPGSLSAHMSRCITLLMQILRTTNDNKTLLDLSIQLRKTPEPDKVYIKESERLAFSDQALMMCSQSLRSQMKNIADMTNPQIVKILQDIFKVYERLQKDKSPKDGQFASLLVEVYKKFIKEKIPDNANVLELATKFCLQNRQADKQKVPPPQKPPVFQPRAPGMATPPTLPTPTRVITPPNLPLKRPGSSRPRGRPPLPRLPGQARQSKGKNPLSSTMSKTTSWQKSLFDQNYAYEYLKHYQDELIKQYSQNLSLPQLSQMVTQAQLATQAGTSQFLAQSGLLNPSALVKQMSAVGAVGQQNAHAQLFDSLNQLNPSLKKKLGAEQAMNNLTGDQLKLLTSLMHPAQKQPVLPNKMASLHSMASSSGIVSGKSKQQLPVARQSGSKSLVVDSAKVKPNPGTSFGKNVQSTQIFKEPAATKTGSTEEKAAKDLMKNRPNISITPVAVNLNPAPTFMRPSPTTSPSSGKTLQEKLADKKKEQQNKEKLDKKKEQLSKQMKPESETRSVDLMKNFGIPTLPSSLTLSQTTVPITSVGKIGGAITVPQKVPCKFPPGLGMPKTAAPLPTSTPLFPTESGISISQISLNKSNRPKEKSNSPQKRDAIALTPSVDISPVKHKPKKVSTKQKKHEYSEKTAMSKQHSKNSSVDNPKRVSDKVKKTLIYSGENKAKSEVVGKPDPSRKEESSDDDIICID